ncbi:hypothetical protein K438DRAFT_684379 [Mycena galopus ATCC 62051]|nr:hypothetical protein K438DRAFT_684379 [Mycena galopus ATCC 62051]
MPVAGATGPLRCLNTGAEQMINIYFCPSPFASRDIRTIGRPPLHGSRARNSLFLPTATFTHSRRLLRPHRSRRCPRSRSRCINSSPQTSTVEAHSDFLSTMEKGRED